MRKSTIFIYITLSTNITANDWPVRKVQITDSGISFLLIGNFDATTTRAVSTGLSGTWYDLMTNEATTATLFNLAPGQFKILTNKIVPPLTGLEQTVGDSGFKLYPNPAKDMLYFNVDGSRIKDLSIYDISGRKLIANPVVSGNSINISSLDPGLYLVIYSLTDGQTGTEKVIIQ